MIFYLKTTLLITKGGVKMKKNNIILGIVLILIGIAYLMNITFQVNYFSFATLWPIILFLVGVMFELKFFRDRSSGGNLIPGGILMVLGLIFMFEKLTGNRFSNYIWPFYTLSVAVGFLQYYLFYKKDRGILILGLILLIVFIVSFLSILLENIFPWMSGNLIFPLILIMAGILVIVKK